MQTIQLQIRKSIEDLQRSAYHQRLGRNLCAALLAEQLRIKLDTALRKIEERSAICGF